MTGGAGFIGSHFIEHIISKGYKVFNYDFLTYAADLNHLKIQVTQWGVELIKKDIRDYHSVLDTFQKFQPNYVVHFAAESHVDKSLADPTFTSDVNVNGTITLLDCFKKYIGSLNGGIYPRFIQISTDEVYGTRSLCDPATEDSLISPSNPYSASKASAELIALSYFRSYGLPILITRCCNNYGPRQNEEKLIPKILNRFKNSTPVPLYGDGRQIRQWLHVRDHVAAVEKIMTSGDAGRIYNIGGNDLISNIDLVKKIAEICGEKLNHTTLDPNLLWAFVSDRPGHDFSYNINFTRLTKELNWSPKIILKDGLTDLINSYWE